MNYKLTLENKAGYKPSGIWEYFDNDSGEWHILECLHKYEREQLHSKGIQTRDWYVDPDDYGFDSIEVGKTYLDNRLWVAHIVKLSDNPNYPFQDQDGICYNIKGKRRLYTGCLKGDLYIQID